MVVSGDQESNYNSCWGIMNVLFQHGPKLWTDRPNSQSLTTCVAKNKMPDHPDWLNAMIYNTVFFRSPDRSHYTSAPWQLRRNKIRSLYNCLAVCAAYRGAGCSAPTASVSSVCSSYTLISFPEIWDGRHAESRTLPKREFEVQKLIQ